MIGERKRCEIHPAHAELHSTFSHEKIIMLWRQLIDDFLVGLHGEDIPIRLNLWHGIHFDLGRAPTVMITARSLRGLRRIVTPTLDGLGEAYVEGEIDVEGDPAEVFNVAVQLVARGGQRAAAQRGAARPQHSRQLDKQAIAYHYDVSNDFYALWLDSNRVYSCGYFRDGEDDLDLAQQRKIDHILRKLQVRPGQHLLDIGCGWGALICRAAKAYGLRATGITLSEQQYEYARERIRREGLQRHCEVRLEDYRDVAGRFDRITSVGMFEHVGLANLPSYFSRIHSLLDDGGVAMNHGITSADPESGDSPLGGGDFIEHYVFPHGELPHISLALKALCAAGLEPVDVESLRRHYALTLQQWSRRLEAAQEQARALIGERRLRIWRMYLAGCAHGFAQNWISIYQILAVKAGGPGLNPLPLTRDYMYAE